MARNLGDWNKSVFANIFYKKRVLTNKIKGVQKALHNRQSTFLINLERELIFEFQMVLRDEESLWHQKVRSDSLSWGDRNTNYFHMSVISKRRKNRISGLYIADKGWSMDEMILKEEVVSFFQNLYSKPCDDLNVKHFSRGFPILSAQKLARMEAVVLDEEVRSPLFYMNPWKAPSYDGFQAGFYQKFWSEIGSQVCEYVHEIFQGGSMLENINRTLLVLIPKGDNPKSLSDFRPIILCIVLYKIVIKVIANMLKGLMNELVLPNQGSFILGRHISNNILIAQEVMHSTKGKKGHDQWMALKIDLKKAYVRV